MRPHVAALLTRRFSTNFTSDEVNVMLLWLALFFIVIGIIMFVHKLVYKNRMEKTLGRKVEDRELTSLSAWMNEDKKPKS